MNETKRPEPATRRLVGLAGALLVLWLSAAAVIGQEPAAPRKVYTRNTVFKLPVQIAESDRADLAQIKLFVKALPGDWICRDTTVPAANAFSFRAPQDGEYWFSFVTVDKAGKSVPADPGAEAPGLVVVVDTQPPEVEVRTLPASSGQTFLQCKLIDANPDYSTVQAECEDGGKWLRLEGLAESPGVFQLPANTVIGKVRVRGADRAGNTVTREIDLGSPKPASASVTQASVSAPLQAIPTPVSARSVAKPAPAPLADLLNSASLAPSPPTAAGFAKEVPLVNSRRCRMDYGIEPPLAGPTRVELWTTPDKGKNWQMKGESRDGRGPIVVEFPSDGLFGYTFVVKSGGTNIAPSAGDPPDGWIEVDTTKPVAELLGAAFVPGAEAGAVQIAWVAHDANLGPDPVTLYYAAQAGGPWQLISAKLANSGGYRWPLPKEIGNRVFIRLEVTDKAGNVTRSDSPTPVSLDPTRPRVTVLNVSPAGLP